MIIVRIFINAIIMAMEAGTIAGLAWIGYQYPYYFAGLTILTSFALGFVLERARFIYDLPFFFEKVGWLARSSTALSRRRGGVERPAGRSRRLAHVLGHG